MIRYRRISVHDPEYAGEKELRHRVLRRPLELALSEEDLRGEASQVHIVAQDHAGKVVGCLLVLFSDERAKVRQLAVDAAYQGRSVGRTLMQLAEEAVRGSLLAGSSNGRAMQPFPTSSPRSPFRMLRWKSDWSPAPRNGSCSRKSAPHRDEYLLDAGWRRRKHAKEIVKRDSGK
jgi:GNAT superfamily N-acetyltransferase